MNRIEKIIYNYFIQYVSPKPDEPERYAKELREILLEYLTIELNRIFKLKEKDN